MKLFIVLRTFIQFSLETEMVQAIFLGVAKSHDNDHTIIFSNNFYIKLSLLYHFFNENKSFFKNKFFY